MAELNGMAELKKAIYSKRKNVKKDVANVVKQSTAQMYRRARQDAHFGRFKLKNPKQKSTGTLRRSIKMQIKDNGLTGITGPTVNYGGYVENGTRFMRAQPYIQPGFDEVSKDFVDELKKLAK